MNTKAYNFYVRLMERFFISFKVVCFGKSPDCTLSSNTLFLNSYTFEGITKVHLFTIDPLTDLDLSLLTNSARLNLISIDSYGNLDLLFEL